MLHRAVPIPDGAGDNHLLTAFPVEVSQRVGPQLESVYLRPGDVIQERCGNLHHAYFPTSTIFSWMYMAEDGTTTEVASVGNDGMLGVALFMGGETMLNQAVVQREGHAYRLSAQVLRNEFGRDEQVKNLLLRYVQFLSIQMAQLAVCYRHHSVQQHLCRWILMNLDRSTGNELNVTQEAIAGMLGVRRESVSGAAFKLQSNGWIMIGRGRITVLDREGLESAVCECYGVAHGEYLRLMPGLVTRSYVRPV
ncbi:MAG: Crp/Fnr family transcriptional regulator [Pseudohongiella sp.]|nr:Crp/Fnr family transcriptional regulator [Pseudohongiella sp.]